MLRVDRTNQVLGTELSSSEIRTLLESIDFEVAKGIRATKDALTFVVPSFRPDITSEIDLIEEVARIYGYDNIETKMRITMQTAESIPPLDIVDSLRDYLAHTGWSEVVANSMQEKSVASLGADKIVEMLNPMSSDMAALPTVWCGLCKYFGIIFQRPKIYACLKPALIFTTRIVENQFVSQYVEEVSRNYCNRKCVCRLGCKNAKWIFTTSKVK